MPVAIAKNESWREQEALKRFQIISPLLQPDLDTAKQLQLRKELAEIVSKSKGICPVCGSECIKSEISEVYICGKCFKAFTMEVAGDESKS